MKSKRSVLSKKRSVRLPRCYLDVSVDGKHLGRIVIQLRADVVPKTVENFRALCTGEKGISYKGCKFHQIVPNFIAQTGDLERNDGTGSYSIYGPAFEDENFEVKHNKPGIVSMANSGRDSNGSQFFITLDVAPLLEGVHVAFGNVIEGMEVVRKIGTFGTLNGVPRREVIIEDCGQIRVL